MDTNDTRFLRLGVRYARTQVHEIVKLLDGVALVGADANAVEGAQERAEFLRDKLDKLLELTA